MTTYTSKPNQSISDVIIMGTGSLEAGMQFCRDNKISPTVTPTPGTVYLVSDAALAKGDAAVLRYLANNKVVLATLAAGSPAMPVFGITDEAGDAYLTDETDTHVLTT